jgi:hypothetical protein
MRHVDSGYTYRRNALKPGVFWVWEPRTKVRVYLRDKDRSVGETASLVFGLDASREKRLYDA